MNAKSESGNSTSANARSAIMKANGLICRGSYALGTACGHCQRCKDEIKELLELRRAVIRMTSQNLDDICWMDLYTELGMLVGVPCHPIMLHPEQMKEQCVKFVDSLSSCIPYSPDRITLYIRHLENVIKLQEGTIKQFSQANKIHGNERRTP